MLLTEYLTAYTSELCGNAHGTGQHLILRVTKLWGKFQKKKYYLEESFHIHLGTKHHDNVMSKGLI